MADKARVIELHMMDKKRYFPALTVHHVMIRGFVFPSLLIKTRLQIQQGRSLYSGAWNAFTTILKTEGVAGMYRGFWVSTLKIPPAMVYVTSYEGTRHFLSHKLGVESNNVKLVSGGLTATVTCRIFMTPVDIVMQHMMLMRDPKVSSHARPQGQSVTLARYKVTGSDASRLGPIRAVLRGIYTDFGLRGFYNGFFVTVAAFMPFNAIYWLTYHHYTVLLASQLPENLPRLAVIAISAPLGAATAGFLTNPLDVIRARIQVNGTRLKDTLHKLWRDEGIGFLTKGVSARMVNVSIHFMFTFIGYETVKRFSLLEQYHETICW